MVSKVKSKEIIVCWRQHKQFSQSKIAWIVQTAAPLAKDGKDTGTDTCNSYSPLISALIPRDEDLNKNCKLFTPRITYVYICIPFRWTDMCNRYTTAAEASINGCHDVAYLRNAVRQTVTCHRKYLRFRQGTVRRRYRKWINPHTSSVRVSTSLPRDVF